MSFDCLFNYQTQSKMHIPESATIPPVSEPIKPKYAFVTLLMGNPRYRYGVLVMVKSLRLSHTTHDIVCMVTPDLYNTYKNILKLFCDDVVLVPYIVLESCRLFSVKQEKMYKKWKDVSCTK